MTISRFTADEDLDHVTTILRRDGAVIIDQAVQADVLERVLEETRHFHEAVPPGPDAFAGRNTRRSGSLLARSIAVRDLVMHPIVIGICDRILGGNSASYQLHLTQLIDIGPGEPAQMLHRDQWAWDQFPFPRGFEVEVSTIWAATEFTEGNGATRIIPGSVSFADDRQVTRAETVPAEMSPGSVVIYTGSVFHGGGANLSDERRIGVNIDYCLGWLRQEENQYLSCPPDVARHLPVDLAKLIGYRRGAYALGYFGDTQDPMDALTEERSTPKGFAT